MTKELETKVNNEWLIQRTGDPFADIGGYVIQYLLENGVTKDKDISQLIEWMTNVYVKKWGGKLNAFFLNSTITQPAFVGERKTVETLGYFKKMLDNELPYKKGYCRISGVNTKLFPAGRDNHILSGSGTFINFNAAHEAGLFLSKEMLIRIFFLPFGILQLGDKIGLIYSNNDTVTKYFVEENCKKNFLNLSQNTEGVLKSDFGNPANALFAFVDQCLKGISKVIDFDEETGISKESINLNLMHFTNFGASPEIVIYSVPALVFDFYARCHSKSNREDWTKFVRSFYRNSKFKDAIFNEENQSWESKKETVGFDSYKTWRNPIYENLLNNQPLFRLFLKWSIKHRIRFEIIELYQTLIRNMDKKAISKIKELADFIVVGREDDYIKKATTKLNGQKSPSELRRYFLTLIHDNFNQGKKDPLITLEEFVEYLFPEGSNWKEIRDLLLIAIYQKMHTENIKIALELAETESDSINETE